MKKKNWLSIDRAIRTQLQVEMRSLNMSNYFEREATEMWRDNQRSEEDEASTTTSGLVANDQVSIDWLPTARDDECYCHSINKPLSAFRDDKSWWAGNQFWVWAYSYRTPRWILTEWQLHDQKPQSLVALAKPAEYGLPIYQASKQTMRQTW